MDEKIGKSISTQLISPFSTIVTPESTRSINNELQEYVFLYSQKPLCK